MGDRNFAVGFSVSPSMNEGLLSPTLAILKEAGLVVVTEQRDTDTYALNAYLMTGVVGYLGHRFVKGFTKALGDDSEKAGKALYEALRNAIVSLYSALADPGRTSRVGIIATQGKLGGQQYLLEISFRAKSLNGVPLLLLFPRQISKADFVAAVEQFCEQVEREQPAARHGMARVFTPDPTSHQLVEAEPNQAEANLEGSLE